MNRALGEAATHLPWLSPGAASLAALARPAAASIWGQVRADPGCVLLLLRQAGNVPASPAASFLPAALHDRAVLDAALRHLSLNDPGFVDWDRPESRPVYRASLACASLAHDRALRSGAVDADNAWAAGLLAPLGWLAVCAVDPAGAAACLNDPEFPAYPIRVQRRLWGLDAGGIARRLARRWQLPRWLALVVGHLGLPAETAATLGADLPLFRTVQAAVRAAQRQGISLGLAVASDDGTAEANPNTQYSVPSGEGTKPAATEAPHSVLSTQYSVLSTDGTRLATTEPPTGAPATGQPVIERWESPAAVPLLPELLRLAAENRRLGEAPVLERLEGDVDHLHHVLEEQRQTEAERLHVSKLEALAELAAGAGHEINNPLAVISGQAQHLLGDEADPARQRALQTIVNQAHRIHQTLTELMQFARPQRPQMQIVDLGSLVRDVVISLQDLAGQRQVRLICPEVEPPVTLCADPRQLRTALMCLLRNAVEAAPADGWAGLRLESAEPGWLELAVEDSGAGPTPEQRAHMFDPFYSGRSAGRGKGLGLPTAWRLARQHGGDVRYDGRPEGPTRFTLRLPLSPRAQAEDRGPEAPPTPLDPQRSAIPA